MNTSYATPGASGSRGKQHTPRIWWLHPGKLTLFFVIPLYFVVVLLPEQWPELVAYTGRVFLWEQYWVFLGFASLLLFGLGCFLGGGLRIGSATLENAEIKESYLVVVGTITVLAYIVWFLPIFVLGLEVLESSAGARRMALNRIAGVTSFSQLGVPFVICYTYCAVHLRQRFRVRVRVLLYLIVTLTLLRVYLWSERQAIIELCVPVMVLVLAVPTARRSRILRSRLVRGLGPFLAIPALLLFFGVTEYFRSWSSYYHAKHPDFSEFVISRFTTYYYTALNNGAGLLSTYDWPTFDFAYVLNWVHRLPAGIGEWFSGLVGLQSSPTEIFLERYGEPQFNNCSGLFVIYRDIGITGGLMYFLSLGIVSGSLHRALLARRKIGVLMFPPVYVACLEILRIPYLSESRCLVLFIGLWIAFGQFRRRSSQYDVTLVSSEPASAA